MSTENPKSGPPVRVYRQRRVCCPNPWQVGDRQRELATAALVSAPILLLIPYVGSLPALIAGTAIGLRGRTHGSGVAITGLIVCIVLFALLAVITNSYFGTDGQNGHFAWCASILQRNDIRDSIA